MVSKEIFHGSTPEGGDYSEAYYFDSKGKSVDKSEATTVIIREMSKDGFLLKETKLHKQRN